MLARVDLRGISGDLRAVLVHPDASATDVAAAVATILADVRARGDAALRQLTARFDGCEIDEFRVAPGYVADALTRIPDDLRRALELARDQIVGWHRAQREKEAQR